VSQLRSEKFVVESGNTEEGLEAATKQWLVKTKKTFYVSLCLIR
jgi:hypothetical protein